jgi:hypothetical protein
MIVVQLLAAVSARACCWLLLRGSCEFSFSIRTSAVELGPKHFELDTKEPVKEKEPVPHTTSQFYKALLGRLAISTPNNNNSSLRRPGHGSIDSTKQSTLLPNRLLPNTAEWSGGEVTTKDNETRLVVQLTAQVPRDD